VQYERRLIAGLMMEINYQKQWLVTRCCGRKFSEKSAAYVSEEQVAVQVK
jgi:hypothetical protein